MNFNQIAPGSNSIVTGESKTSKSRLLRTEIGPFPHSGILPIRADEPPARKISAVNLSTSTVKSCYTSAPVERHAHLARAFHQTSVKLSATHTIPRPFGDSRADRKFFV